MRPMFSHRQNEDCPQFLGLTLTILLSHAFQKAYQNTVSQNDFILGKNLDTFNSIKNLETLELHMLLTN